MKKQFLRALIVAGAFVGQVQGAAAAGRTQVQRVADLERHVQADVQQLTVDQAARVEAEMKIVKKVRNDREQKQVVENRVNAVIRSKDRFKDLYFSSVDCSYLEIGRWDDIPEEGFDEIALRYNQSAVFGKDKTVGSSYKKKISQDSYVKESVFENKKYPLDFADTFYLWKVGFFLKYEDFLATDLEFSLLFRLLYDCARGFYEDPDLTSWNEVVKRKKAYFKAAHIPEATRQNELLSWAEKLPLLIAELHKIERAFDDVSGGTTNFNHKSLLNVQANRFNETTETAKTFSDIQGYLDKPYNSKLAQHFRNYGTPYEKEMFKNQKSNIYLYMAILNRGSLGTTQAGRDALSAVDAFEVVERVQQQPATRQPQPLVRQQEQTRLAEVARREEQLRAQQGAARVLQQQAGQQEQVRLAEEAARREEQLRAQQGAARVPQQQAGQQEVETAEKLRKLAELKKRAQAEEAGRDRTQEEAKATEKLRKLAELKKRAQVEEAARDRTQEEAKATEKLAARKLAAQAQQSGQAVIPQAGGAAVAAEEEGAVVALRNLVGGVQAEGFQSGQDEEDGVNPITVARDALIYQWNLIALNSEKEKSFASNIPGFQQLTEDQQNLLTPSHWPEESPFYTIALVAVHQIIFNMGVWGNPEFNSQEKVKDQFKKVYAIILSLDKINFKLNFDHGPTQEKIANAVAAIVQLNKNFREAAVVAQSQTQVAQQAAPVLPAQDHDRVRNFLSNIHLYHTFKNKLDPESQEVAARVKAEIDAVLATGDTKQQLKKALIEKVERDINGENATIWNALLREKIIFGGQLFDKTADRLEEEIRNFLQ